MKMPCSLSPDRNKYSATRIMTKHNSNIIMLDHPIFLIKSINAFFFLKLKKIYGWQNFLLIMSKNFD